MFQLCCACAKGTECQMFSHVYLSTSCFPVTCFFSMFSQYKSLKPFQYYQSETNNGFNKEIQHAYNLIVSIYYYN